MSDYDRPVVQHAADVMAGLEASRTAVQKAAKRLYDLSTRFHYAEVDPQTGEVSSLGVGLRYDIAVKDELATIYELAIQNGTRPPAEDIRTAMAERAVRTKFPALYAEYHTTLAQITGLKAWISNEKSAISAGQSVLKGERE